MGRLNTIISEACEGLAEVDGALIERETLKNLYDGVAEKDVNTALVMTARTLVEREPNYSYVTARLLMDTLRAEALGFLGVAESATHHEMAELYAKALPAYIEKGAEFELVDAKLKEFDLEKLGKAIDHERDQQFTYLGLQTLYDRYFIHKDGIRFELPQIFFMRVAMGLAIEEKDREARTIEFYNLLSSFDYMSSTPTLFNAGTLRPQLSSCYLTTVPDDLSWPWATAWAAAGAALASVGSSLSNSSQLSILLSPGLAAVSAAWIWGVRCTRKRWSGTVWPGRSSPPEGRRGLFLALARGLVLPAWRWTSDRQAPGRPDPREESGLPGRDTDAVQRRAITGRLRSRGCRCCMPAAPAPASARRPGWLAGRRCHRPTRR